MPRGGIGDGAAIHFEAALRKIDDPVIREAGPSVEGALHVAVDGETAQGHLDDQDRSRRMRVAIIPWPTGDDAHIGLGLRLAVEGNRQAGPTSPPRQTRDGAPRPRGGRRSRAEFAEALTERAGRRATRSVRPRRKNRWRRADRTRPASSIASAPARIP